MTKKYKIGDRVVSRINPKYNGIVQGAYADGKIRVAWITPKHFVGVYNITDIISDEPIGSMPHEDASGVGGMAAMNTPIDMKESLRVFIREAIEEEIRINSRGKASTVNSNSNSKSPDEDAWDDGDVMRSEDPDSSNGDDEELNWANYEADGR